MDEQARRKPRIQFGGRTGSGRVQLKAQATMALANPELCGGSVGLPSPTPAFFFGRDLVSH